jgi:hypothetical protein
LELDKAPTEFGVCHCDSCRRWSGGVFMSVYGGKAYKFLNEDKLTRYSSSEWAERGSCKKCGSHVFFRMKKSDTYFFMLGLFGDKVNPTFSEQQFIDVKPSNYSFSNQTKNITKSEMHKMLNNYLNQ